MKNIKPSTKIEHNSRYDIEIEVVENGFIAKCGTKNYVFSDLRSLDSWIKDNLSTPEDGSAFVKRVLELDSNTYFGPDIAYGSSTKDWAWTEKPQYNTTTGSI